MGADMHIHLHWYDVLGLIGVALIAGAYLAIQAGWILSTRLLYSFWNGAGALLVLVSLAFDFNLSAAVVEVFWLAISFLGAWRWWSNNRGSRVGVSGKS